MVFLFVQNDKITALKFEEINPINSIKKAKPMNLKEILRFE